MSDDTRNDETRKRGLIIAVSVDEVREHGPREAIVLQQLRHFGALHEAADGWVTRTHDEWADVTGLTAQVVFRVLHKLVDDGLVEVDGAGNTARWWRIAVSRSGSRIRDTGIADSRSAPLLQRGLEVVPKGTTARAPARERPSFIDWFDTFWSLYPRHVGRRNAEAAFARALKRADLDTIIVGTKAYRDDPNRTDEFTAHPTTWLNRDGWDDAPLPARGGRTDRPFGAGVISNAQRLAKRAEGMGIG